MADNEQRPIIIKKKKVVGGDGHHGGAWKVAYADFVTAMMAFFLLMWLLNATTEDQKRGLADYFNPTIPLHRTSGGGDGPLKGNTSFAELTAAQNGTGATQERPSAENRAKGASGLSDSPESEADEEAALISVEQRLSSLSGESDVADPLLEHIRTRVTDEGLVIDIFDLETSPLWEGQSDQPTDKMRALMTMIASVAEEVTNSVAVKGHLNATSLTGTAYDGWQLSTDRALMARTLLARGGMAPLRFQRVTGKADRVPVVEDPFDVRNRRIEIVLLRKGRT